MYEYVYAYNLTRVHRKPTNDHKALFNIKIKLCTDHVVEIPSQKLKSLQASLVFFFDRIASLRDRR